MKRAFPIEFQESYLPSPRHRKPSFRTVTEQVEVEIRETTGVNAPIAIVEQYDRLVQRTGWMRDRDFGTRTGIEYRWFHGSFYAPTKRSRFISGGKGRATIADLGRWLSVRTHRERDVAIVTQQQAAAHFLIVDGILYAGVEEPRYYILTQGLGNNHGATSLNTDRCFNPNISPSRYFRADEGEQAHAEALRIATARGDTDSARRLRRRQYSRLVVKIPASVRIQRTDHRHVSEFTYTIERTTDGALPPAVAAIVLLGQALKN